MIPFSKYSGAGNDFVVVRARAVEGDPRRLAQRVCSRKTGVGVDGLALVEPAGPRRLRVRFFNPDGSEFGTCGNGSRCVARFAVDEGLVDGPGLTLDTAEGDVEATVKETGVTLEFRLEAWVAGRHVVAYRDRELPGWLVQMGTPHFVLAVDTLPDEEIDELARPVRHDPALGPDGANVNLVQLTGPATARIRTYERGVEAETLACGAGSMAATLALHAAGRCEASLALDVRSGETLRVSLRDADAGEEPSYTSPARRTLLLTGPARRIFEGRFPAEGGPGPGR